MAMQPYEHLYPWKRLLRLVEVIYAQTELFPDSEKSGMTATLRRGVTAAGAKLADAASRDDDAAAANGLDAVAAALVEVDAHLLIAHRLGYLSAWRTRQLRRRIADLQQELTSLAATWREESLRLAA